MRIEEALAQRSFKDNFQKGYLNLIFTASWVNSYSAKFFKEFDITPQQYNVLRILRGQYPKPCGVGIIKERILDRTSDVSRIVDRLDRRKWINRKVNSLDKRAVDITINDTGLGLLSKIDERIEKLHNPLRNLTDEEIQLFNDLLDKVRTIEMTGSCE